MLILFTGNRHYPNNIQQINQIKLHSIIGQPVRLRVNLTQNSYEPGANLMLRAVLTEHSLPLESGATVDAELTRPDNTSTNLTLAEVSKGIYETTVIASLSGIYRFRVRARGTTLRGLPFTREQELTGAVWKGGDNPPPSGKDDSNEQRERLCRLLVCLFGKKNFSPELMKRLTELGINLADFRQCLEKFCAGPRPAAMEEIRKASEMFRRFVTELRPEDLEILQKIAQEPREDN